MDQNTSVFGEKMKEQVEERLRFYEEGVAPRKNAAVMGEAVASVKTAVATEDAAGEGKKKKDKKVLCLAPCVAQCVRACVHWGWVESQHGAGGGVSWAAGPERRDEITGKFTLACLCK